MDYMGLNKKVEARKMRFVLFRDVDDCYVTANAPANLLKQTLMSANGSGPK